MPVNKITWSENAIKQFSDTIEFIMDDSVQGAESFQDKLIARLDLLSNNAEMFPLDKYKTNNNGSFRAFIVFHYRVSYRSTPGEIRILRIRHSSMIPKFF